MQILTRFLLCALLAVPSISLMAADNKGQLAFLQQLLQSNLRAPVGEVTPAPVPGFFQAIVGNEQVIYISEDGRYVMQGSLIDLQTRQNLSEQLLDTQLRPVRKAAIDAVDEASMVVFTPKQTKHTVTVFTDIDCFYCRKLHAEIEQLTAMGIKVRYMAFPRAGVDSPSYFQAVNVWCAKDQQAAMTQAKRQQPVAPATCDHQIKQHMQVVRDLGLRGTPAMVLENGQLLAGYVPANELLGILESAAP